MKGVRIMKKFVAVLMISFLFLLCGCTRSTSGRIDELRENSWEAQFEGGATVSLSFDGDEASLRCATGTFAVEGRNFFVPRMNPTHELRIRTSHDNLATILYGVRGDTAVNVSRGVVMRTEIDEDGKVQHVAETPNLEWRLSPGTRVQINRAVPAVGEKMSVSVMTFAADGSLKNHFAYVEGLAAVNSGELVAASKEESDKLAKRAAEAAGDAAAAAEEAENQSGADGDSSGYGNEEE